MSNIKYYILFSVTLLLQSCDFFYSTVNYTGKEADPRLCVVSHLSPPATPADMARIYVLHSEFFLNTGSSTIPVLDDAKVTLQVNNEQSVNAVYQRDTDTTYSWSEDGVMHPKVIYGGHYEAPVLFAANDTVRLHVEHPTYGTADALQICPAQQGMMFETDSLNKYGELWCHVHLSAYGGTMTDVLAMQVTINDDQKYIYSYAEDFAEYDNYQTRSLHYAGKSLLLAPSQQERDIPFIINASYLRYRNMSDPAKAQNDTDTLDATLTILSQTHEGYAYQSSLARASGRAASEVPELASQNTGSAQQGYGDMTNILDEITEAFDVLGNVEGYQVYGNLSGKNAQNVQPFGCFSLLNTNKQTVRIIIHYI